jgi:acyl-CoA thioesterase FadM
MPVASPLKVLTMMSDFDSHFTIPPSVYFRWAMESRLMGFRTDPGLGKVLTQVDGAIMVKAQVLRLLDADVLSRPGVHVCIQQHPHSIGRTSFTLRYDYVAVDENKLIAQAMIVMVKVGPHGAAQLPAWMHAEIAWGVPVTTTVVDGSSLRPSEDLVVGSSALDQFLQNVGPLQTSHDVLTRPSDEDTNQHVNHARIVSFFEDAIALMERPWPDVFYIDYVSQLRKQTECEVRFAYGSKADTSVKLLMFLNDKKDKDHPVNRVFCQWSARQIEAP